MMTTFIAVNCKAELYADRFLLPWLQDISCAKVNFCCIMLLTGKKFIYKPKSPSVIAKI